MNARAWFSQLQSNKMFKVIKESLPETVTRTQCILECKNDILYLWNQLDNAVLTLNLKNSNTGNKDAAFQVLVATTPACFDAHALCASVAATRLCAWGPRGALILELPTRWGRTTAAQSPQPERTFCSSVILDERFFLTECELRQVRWHPGSSSDSHILLLAADNTIRLYETSAGYGSGVGVNLLRVLAVGRRPGAPLASIPILASLGHTAVDFDVAPPAPRLPPTSEKALLEWPLLVLRGNGDVYMIDGSIDIPRSTKPKLVGPLTMYPPADDNYGVDSCSILVLGASANSSAGVVVAISTSAGMVYHCLLLPDNNTNGDDEESENTVTRDYNNTGLDRSGLNLTGPGELTRALYVIEAIELDIGLILSDNDPSYSCPIYLKSVESCRDQYLCIHEAGVHVINVPLVAELENFIHKENASLSVMCSYESTAMYSVCTATARRPNSANKPLGAVGANAHNSKMEHGANMLIVLLGDGSVMGRFMEPHHATERLFNDMTVKAKKQLEGPIDTTLAELRKHPFDVLMREILKSDLSQPILKMSSTEEPSLEECLEICSSAHRSIGSRLQRHRAAMFELQRRTRVLRTLLQHQKSAIADASSAIDALKVTSDRCKCKSETAVAAQNKINERYFNASRALRAKCAGEDSKAPLVGAEQALDSELKAASSKVAHLSDQLSKVKLKMAYQEKQMLNWEEDRKRKEMYLGQSHSDTIKTILEQQNNQIKGLVSDINNLKSCLGTM